MRLRLPSKSLLACAALLAASPTWAHPGHDETTNAFSSFGHGMVHPLSGADHILAMVMVGLFAVQLGGRALWLLPATFLVAMAAGAAIGLSAGASGWVEIDIALSIVLLGALLAFRIRMPVAVAAAVVAAVALLHGHAHGAEAPDGMSLAYFGGMLLGTAVLHLTGILAAIGFAAMSRQYGSLLLRVAGGIGVGAGVLLLATV